MLKYVITSTKPPPCMSRLPIYVDPVGLQEAGQTMTSPVQIDAQGIPLKTSLRAALNRIGLNYLVKDGLLTITAQGSEDEMLGEPQASILSIVVLYVIAPSLLLALFVWLLAMGRWGASRDGLAVGLAVALWASACWLTGGYLGAWLNIPSVLLVVLAFGSELGRDTWWMELAVVGANFLTWPLLGWLFFRTVTKVFKLGPALPHVSDR
jgi:hypothetical protein